MWKATGSKSDHSQDDEHLTFLARDASFKGEAHVDGTVRVDGRFEGELHSKGSVVVGEHAVIKGIVNAGTVIVGGKIHGGITGSEKIQLLKSAVLIGDVRTPSFSMEEGAHFHGQCEMGADRWMQEEPREGGAVENVRDLATHRERLRAQEGPN
jgi:cytoskeletal protein CcmA (bactofilin family)